MTLYSIHVRVFFGFLFLTPGKRSGSQAVEGN